MDTNKHAVQIPLREQECGQDGTGSPTQRIRGWSPEGLTPLPLPGEQLWLGGSAIKLAHPAARLPLGTPAYTGCGISDSEPIIVCLFL